MRLYLISQTVNRGYDTYDSAVVAAVSPVQAKKMHPRGELPTHRDPFMDWAKPEDIQVELIGIAKPRTKAGVILASFNAG